MGFRFTKNCHQKWERCVLHEYPPQYMHVFLSGRSLFVCLSLRGREELGKRRKSHNPLNPWIRQLDPKPVLLHYCKQITKRILHCLQPKGLSSLHLSWGNQKIKNKCSTRAAVQMFPKHPCIVWEWIINFKTRMRNHQS